MLNEYTYLLFLIIPANTEQVQQAAAKTNFIISMPYLCYWTPPTPVMLITDSNLALQLSQLQMKS